MGSSSSSRSFTNKYWHPKYDIEKALTISTHEQMQTSTKWIAFSNADENKSLAREYNADVLLMTHIDLLRSSIEYERSRELQEKLEESFTQNQIDPNRVVMLLKKKQTI